MVIIPDIGNGNSGVYSVERPELRTGVSETGNGATWLTGWDVWNNELGKRENLDWPLADRPITVIHVKD